MTANRSASAHLGVEVGAGPAATPCVDLILPDGTRLQLEPESAVNIAEAILSMAALASSVTNYLNAKTN